MWNPRDFSYRKFRRKWIQDGPTETIRASAEFATRKLLAPPILHEFIDRDILYTIDRDELISISDRIYSSQRETQIDSLIDLSDAEFVAEIDHGYVFPNTGLGTDKKGRPIRETVEPPHLHNDFVIETIVWHGFYDSPLLASGLCRGSTSTFDKYAESIDTACPLCPRFTNYYHWMIETVPKIRYIQEYESVFNVDVTYLVPANMPQWLDDTLELLEIPDKKIKRATAPVYKINQMLVPSFPQLKKENYQWLRNHILANADMYDGDIDVGNNVYISRKNTVERRVTNEKEVIDAISEYGFKRFQLEHHHVAENARLFNEADIVVGAHGAGLTDIIFCNSGSTVIELFGSKIKPPYEKLADVLGVGYQSINCNPQSTDLEVDISQLENKIRQIER